MLGVLRVYHAGCPKGVPWWVREVYPGGRGGCTLGREVSLLCTYPGTMVGIHRSLLSQYTPLGTPPVHAGPHVYHAGAHGDDQCRMTRPWAQGGKYPWVGRGREPLVLKSVRDGRAVCAALFPLSRARTDKDWMPQGSSPCILLCVHPSAQSPLFPSGHPIVDKCAGRELGVRVNVSNVSTIGPCSGLSTLYAQS